MTAAQKFLNFVSVGRFTENVRKYAQTVKLGGDLCFVYILDFLVSIKNFGCVCLGFIGKQWRWRMVHGAPRLLWSV